MCREIQVSVDSPLAMTPFDRAYAASVKLTVLCEWSRSFVAQRFISHSES